MSGVECGVRELRCHLQKRMRSILRRRGAERCSRVQSVRYKEQGEMLLYNSTGRRTAEQQQLRQLQFFGP